MSTRDNIPGPFTPVILLATIVAMVAANFAMPLIQYSSGWQGLGAGFILAGIAVTLWAAGRFVGANTAIRPSEPSTSLVTAGPFAFSRNPMYLGMVTVLTGVALLMGSATPWLGIPVFVWLVTTRFIVPEERKMEAAFGEPYREYKARVRRWL